MGQDEGRDESDGTHERRDRLPQPFGPTVVTAWHVERPETARVLTELAHGVALGRQTGALMAPPGLGRTHLARVFAERTDPDRLRCVYLPQARFGFTDLCHVCVAWATGRRDVPRPEEALRELLHEVWGEGRSLLVVLDDADSMPAATAEAWLELTVRQVPSLISLFVTRDDGAAPCLAALGSDEAPIVKADVPMSERETCEYVLDRLARVGARPNTLACFSEEVVERLHMLSGGWPVRLHALAQLHLDMPGLTPELAPSWLERLASIAFDLDGAEVSTAAGGADRLSA